MTEGTAQQLVSLLELRREEERELRRRLEKVQVQKERLENGKGAADAPGPDVEQVQIEIDYCRQELQAVRKQCDLLERLQAEDGYSQNNALKHVS